MYSPGSGTGTSSTLTVKSGPPLTTTPALQVFGISGAESEPFEEVADPFTATVMVSMSVNNRLEILLSVGSSMNEMRRKKVAETLPKRNRHMHLVCISPD